LHVLDEAWAAEGTLGTLGLRLHPEKTGVVGLARGAEGVVFLGFEHRMRKSWRTGYWYLQKWPSPRAMASIRGNVRDRTDRRYARLPLEYAVENVSHVVPWLGELLPLRKLRGEVLSDRQRRQ
jgi:hypothetical protein